MYSIPFCRIQNRSLLVNSEFLKDRMLPHQSGVQVQRRVGNAEGTQTIDLSIYSPTGRSSGSILPCHQVILGSPFFDIQNLPYPPISLSLYNQVTPEMAAIQLDPLRPLPPRKGQ